MQSRFRLTAYYIELRKAGWVVGPVPPAGPSTAAKAQIPSHYVEAVLRRIEWRCPTVRHSGTTFPSMLAKARCGDCPAMYAVRFRIRARFGVQTGFYSIAWTRADYPRTIRSVAPPVPYARKVRMSQNAARYAQRFNFPKGDSALDWPERRLHPRRSSYCMAHIRSQQSAGGTYQAATIWDVSSEGIGFLLDYPLEPGVLLDVQFRHLTVKDRVAEVMHATVREGGWIVGCKLKEPLSMIEARALGA